MITNQKIEVGDVAYSRLSQTLRFTVAANASTIQTIEDICNRNDMTMEEIAHHMGELLDQAVFQHYTRGGLRRKYD